MKQKVEVDVSLKNSGKWMKIDHDGYCEITLCIPSTELAKALKLVLFLDTSFKATFEGEVKED